MTVPTNLPKRWRCLGRIQDPGGMTSSNTHAFLRKDGLRAIFSVEVHPDGRWLHLSISHENKLPTWGELVASKLDFFGTHVAAVQIIPPQHQYVNAHNYTLHLWHFLDGPCWPIVEGR